MHARQADRQATKEAGDAPVMSRRADDEGGGLCAGLGSGWEALAVEAEREQGSTGSNGSAALAAMLQGALLLWVGGGLGGGCVWGRAWEGGEGMSRV
jgi:hypothetical protein